VTALTIFTPTYNRADTLPRTFASLKQQTSRDFVWFIVDDGSTDESRELIAGWIASADFHIKYVYQPNAGKHTAHNLAVSRSQTELFLILDADDELLPHAVDLITSEWARIPRAEKNRLAGIWTLSCTDDGQICGDRFPENSLDTSLQAMRYKYRCSGERLPCFTTAVLREHLFPSTPPGLCAYISEGYIWTAITRRYVIRFLNVPCRTYHQGCGLSAMARHEYRMSRSVVFGYAAPLTNDWTWFWYAPGVFLFSAIQVVRYGMFCGELRRIAQPLCWQAKALLLGAVPVAVFLLTRDYVSGRIGRQLAPKEQSRGA
jgi:glycosyltransferase involved in cell wall biosynthesis